MVSNGVTFSASSRYETASPLDLPAYFPGRRMLGRELSLIFCLVLIAGPALSQDCASIENPADRLSCFDAGAGRSNIPPIQFGNWEVLDFSGDPIATTDSTDEVQCGPENGTATLTLDCTADMPLLYVSLPCRPTSPSGQVLTVFDLPTNSFEQVLSPSQDGKSLGTWMNDIQAIRALSDGPLTLSFAGTDVTLTPATFDLTGFQDLQGYLLENQCIWMPKAG